MAGRKISFSVSFLSIAASLIFASGNGCPKSTGGNGGGGGPTPTPTPTPTPPVFEVTIGPLDPIIKAGVELKLTATAANAIGEVAYTWKVNDQEIGNTNALTYIPSLNGEVCDQPLKISVTAKDSDRTATTSVDTIASKTWCTYTTENTGVGGLLSNVTTKLALGKDGKKLWVGTNAGLNSFDGSAWTRITSSNSPLGKIIYDFTERIYINAVFEANDTVWVAACLAADTSCEGIQRFNASSPAFASWRRYAEYADTQGNEAVVPSSYAPIDVAKEFALLNDQFILVATRNKLTAIDILTYPAVSSSVLLRDKVVNAITFDGAGRIWLGTGGYNGGEGIWVYKSIGDTNPEHFSQTGWEGGQRDIRTLASNGNIMYVGFATRFTLGGGFVKGKITGSNSDGNPIVPNWERNTAGTSPQMPGNDIRKIVIGRVPHVWVATKTGLGRYSEDNGLWVSDQFKSATVKNLGGLGTDDLNDLAYDPKTDTLWISTNGGGLTRLRVGLL